jgi:hypothetical protein
MFIFRVILNKFIGANASTRRLLQRYGFMQEPEFGLLGNPFPESKMRPAGMTRKLPATLFQSPLRFSYKFLRAPQVFPGYPYADAAPPRAIGEGCESADGK